MLYKNQLPQCLKMFCTSVLSVNLLRSGNEKIVVIFPSALIVLEKEDSFSTHQVLTPYLRSYTGVKECIEYSNLEDITWLKV